MNIQIGYGQIDPSAKPDSMPSTTDKQSWVNLDDLKIDGLEVKNIATCEHNQAILDGTQEHLPDKPELYTWGLWSASMSDESGLFASPPTLDIGFNYNHKSPGLTLLFYPHSDDYAEEVRVTWYSTPPQYEYKEDGRGGFIQIEIYSGVIITSGIYTILSNIGQINENVTGFKHIKIEFLSTNIRHRYIKLAGINYGAGKVFEDSDIDTANILEEIDPISNRISINTLNFRIKTHEADFSMVSGIAGDSMLMRNQQFNVVADNKDFGTFFLQFPWRDVYGTGSVFDFQAIDAIGVMGKYQFWGGIYNNVTIESIIAELFRICFPTQLIRYQIDPVFAGRRVSGWIPITTCHEALRYICFAIGAVADTSRRDYVWIYERDREITHVIPKEHLYIAPTLSPTDYCSGVDVVAYEYVPSDEIVEAHKATYPIGRRPIKFSEPLYDIQVSGAQKVEQSENHVIINVTVAGEIIITGKRYIVNTPVFSAHAEVEAGEVESVVTYDNCTLVHPSYAQAVADDIFSHLKQRARIETDVRLGDLEPGYIAEVPTYDRPINGTIEQLDISLRGGRARMKVIGDVADPRNG